jgi:perosamine synthetase
VIGGIDTNILIYAHDNSSPFQKQALHLLERIFEGGIVAVAELSLREFYAVVTDGRKLNNPFSIDEAKDIVSDIYASSKFSVCSTNRETWLNSYELAGKYNVARYLMDDLLIALSLADSGAELIYTANIKDFEKFDFIQAINPFSSDDVRQATSAKRFIPYGRQSIDEKDIAAVCSVLRSDWLTTGPKVEEFEQAFAQYVGAKYAVAVSSGTAALHTAMYAIGIGLGDEVIVPPITFAATANCVVYQGGTPVFSDVEPDTLLLDPKQVESKITPKTKAIIAVDYAGQPCDYDALRKIADQHNLFLVADACHALGGSYKGRLVGSLADLNIFSFHPVKHITTGEGGMITTDDSKLVERMRIFRNHGITTDHRQREQQGSWLYEMVELGYNYRLTDIQCALGISQLRKVPAWVARRQLIARRYDAAFSKVPGVAPLVVRDYVSHAYHLYVIRLDTTHLRKTRSEIFSSLRSAGIGVNVHYIPVHLHAFYRCHFGTKPGLCPEAESVYEQLITLPLFPMMTDQNVEEVITAMAKLIKEYAE